MFRLAVDSITVSANHEGASGWSCRIGARRGDEHWRDVEIDSYTLLSTDELYDVIVTALAVQLGLA